MLCLSSLYIGFLACSSPVTNSNNNNSNTNNTNNNKVDTGKPNRPDDAKFTDQETKVVYDGWLKVRGSEVKQYLMGTGVRTKTILNVQVYAIGFYIDTTVAREQLKPWKGKSKEDLIKDNSYYDLLLNGKFGKALRLVMVRDVDKKTMADAFEESLKPRIDKLPADKKADANKALEQFKGYFDKDVVNKDILQFVWLSDGSLHVDINDAAKGTIMSADFSQALFDVYLGAEPISEIAKKDFVSGMTDMF